MAQINDRPAPYVGARPFQPEEHAYFYGRDKEARTLAALLLANRLLLFYAQSGAGKSSLINTRLTQDMLTKGFEVLPIGRLLGSDLQPHEIQTDIFSYNLMLSLHTAPHPPEMLAQLSLTDFLDGLMDDPAAGGYRYVAPHHEFPLTSEEIKPRLLVIDQFEEVLTSHLDQWERRTEFFEQLTDLLQQDPDLWLLLAMRDDYIAGLDPYVTLLPGQLRGRYYMARMESEAAMEAIQRPMEEHTAYRFEPQVVERMVNDLRQISVPVGLKEAATRRVMGQYVDPMQLQLVCQELWHSLQHP